MEIISIAQPRTFRLSKSFLESYYLQGDPFQNLLARSTYLTKYCRDGETWTDTIRRVVEGNVQLAAGVHPQEAEKLFNLFWTGQALPPGRGLWTGGVEGIPADSRYNCFSRETRFFADGKLVSFDDVIGQTVNVRCVDGAWRPAEVRSFGAQHLFKFVLKAPGRSNFKFEYTATENHRWITENRGIVTDLKVGDTIRVTPDVIDADSSAYKDGFVHGLIFGEGSALGEGIYSLRLCGEKSKHLDALKAYNGFVSSSNPSSYGGDPIVRIKNSTTNLKGLPLEGTAFEYQAGFLAGWLATDGSLRSRGGNRLSSINHEALNWVIDRAPFLGYCVFDDTIDSSEETNFGKRNGLVRVLMLTPESVLYTVRQKIDEGREEVVYCVTEPITHTFTIEGGVRTGQCWYTTLYDIDDWCWTANQLMLGGGVGVGLTKIDTLGAVAQADARFAVWCQVDHENSTEVNPDPKSFLNGQTPIFRVPDSREGWVDALRRVMASAWEGKDLICDVSDIRPRGRPIRTFGGVACGPGPLVNLLRNAWTIIRGAAGRKLTSVECLDITNYIGLCIKAGNVRRSALICVGNANDQAFRNAKKDWEKVTSHRHTSNNSIVFEEDAEIANFDWASLVEDNAIYGEPGILNLARIRKTDPGAMGINPCGEIPLHDREACNLAEVFPAQFVQGTNAEQVFRLVTRYCLRQKLTPLTDPKSHKVNSANMRIGVGLGGICDFDWTDDLLSNWYQSCREEGDRYSAELGVPRPIAVTTTKPSGTISLLNGSSPGVHAPYAPFYLRRTRIAKNDALAAALMDAGVPYETDIYDATGHTLTFGFPMKARHTRVTVQTETIRDQFERQHRVQQAWADNSVSATLSFAEHEKEELAKCLKEYVPELKSTSCLPKAHGYAQAPYEAIDEETYQRLHDQINHWHPLTTEGGDIEIEECAGGACPVR